MPSPEKLARTGIPKPRAWTFGMRRPGHIGNDDYDVAILVLGLRANPTFAGGFRMFREGRLSPQRNILIAIGSIVHRQSQALHMH